MKIKLSMIFLLVIINLQMNDNSSETMKNQTLESIRDELFHIMKLKNKPISERVKTKMMNFIRNVLH